METYNLTGQRFGRLVVSGALGSRKGKRVWLCRCDCGNEKIVETASLLSGNTKSCGCATGRFIDETGKVYGRLTVISLENDKRNGAMWRCRCECGNEVIVRGNQLRRGITKSCGCLRTERAFERVSLPKGIAGMNRAIGNMRGNARRRHIAWELTDDQVIHLMKQDCHYCGVSPTHVSKARNGDYTYNGLDRVNNSKGYSAENVVPCCATCNNAKRTMSLDEFLGWIHRVYEHSLAGASQKELT